MVNFDDIERIKNMNLDDMTEEEREKHSNKVEEQMQETIQKLIKPVITFINATQIAKEEIADYKKNITEEQIKRMMKCRDNLIDSILVTILLNEDTREMPETRIDRALHRLDNLKKILIQIDKEGIDNINIERHRL